MNGFLSEDFGKHGEHLLLDPGSPEKVFSLSVARPEDEPSRGKAHQNPKNQGNPKTGKKSIVEMIGNEPVAKLEPCLTVVQIRDMIGKKMMDRIEEIGVDRGRFSSRIEPVPRPPSHSPPDVFQPDKRPGPGYDSDQQTR